MKSRALAGERLALPVGLVSGTAIELALGGGALALPVALPVHVVALPRAGMGGESDDDLMAARTLHPRNLRRPPGRRWVARFNRIADLLKPFL